MIFSFFRIACFCLYVLLYTIAQVLPYVVHHHKLPLVHCFHLLHASVRLVSLSGVPVNSRCVDLAPLMIQMWLPLPSSCLLERCCYDAMRVGTRVLYGVEAGAGAEARLTALPSYYMSLSRVEYIMVLPWDHTRVEYIIFIHWWCSVRIIMRVEAWFPAFSSRARDLYAGYYVSTCTLYMTPSPGPSQWKWVGCLWERLLGATHSAQMTALSARWTHQNEGAFCGTLESTLAPGTELFWKRSLS